MFLNQIDWSRPWLAPLRATAAPIIRSADWRQALNEAAAERVLRNHRGLPIRFVLQSDLPPVTAYESFISATGSVPTRDNLHDFFNALIWLTFPQTKACLNALQAAEIARVAAGGTSDKSSSSGRGKLRDAATIFDENAALLIVRDIELLAALRERRWVEAFIERRSTFGPGCEVWLFGHALIEKLVTPYKAITAHAWALIEPAFFQWEPAHKREWLDMTVAGKLSANVDVSDFLSLPVLGVPEWWVGQDRAFYEDALVFRPQRHMRR